MTDNRGMVIAPEPLAIEAGERAFEQGGNAVDAAVAAAFTQTVVNPLLCGIGGTGLALLHETGSDASRVVDCSVTCGSRPLPDEFVDGYRDRAEVIGRYVVEGKINQMGYQSIMVPGFIRGCYALYSQYGSGAVDWEQLIGPARRHAGDGFEVYPYIADFMAPKDGKPGYPGTMEKLTHTEEVAEIYLNGDRPYRTGERLVQKDLARTLERIAGRGAEEFYTGETGRRMADDLEQHDALVTQRDLETFKVLEIEPLTGSYRGYKIEAPPPQGSGPQVIEMLHILEHFDLEGFAPDDPEYVTLLVKVMRASFVDNVLLKGDPPYSVANALMERITSKERAAFWARKIKQGEEIAGPPYATGLGSDTTHVTTADDSGLIVSYTHSTGSVAGSGVVTPGLGFIYNNFLGHFNPRPGRWDSIVREKRGGGGVPTIVYRDGEPYIAIGSPGGSRLITSLVQSLVNVIDFGMDMREAVSVPRLHSEERDLVFLEPAFSDEAAEHLGDQGYRVQRSTYMARMQAIRFGADGGMEAGLDPRSGGGVMG